LMPGTAGKFARLRPHQARQGTPIGPNDLLIAAQALATNLTVVTANTREFTRALGLKTENWLEGTSINAVFPLFR